MNNRERTLAILNYQPYDRLPLVHFGFWNETLALWADQGHLTHDLARAWVDGNHADGEISRMLGFDFNWSSLFGADLGLRPPIERKVVEEFGDGSRHVLNEDGAIIVEKPGVTSIPTEVGHLLKDRASWEETYKPRLQWTLDRLDDHLKLLLEWAGKEFHLPLIDRSPERLRPAVARLLLDLAQKQGRPLGVWCGSLFGKIRDYVGLVGLSYLTVDDPGLLDEMIETVAELCYQGVKAALEAGIHFDFALFWEDICYRAGPLVNPRLFRARVGPGYRRITELLNRHGVNIVSLDCDGKIDALVPIWLENGVNTMFPIEVGTWNASIQPWRERYGRELRGVGGMDKRGFARDYAAVDTEVERLRPLVALGGYIPCPDHRIPPDAKWENVQYYCERMRRVFG